MIERIGESPPRSDGLPKVSGAALYGDDVAVEGLLFGATVRSQHAHARIDAVRFDAAKAPPGTVFVTASDIEGPNGVQLIDDRWPILAHEVTQHVGEPVALVAAASRLDALRALAAVEVDYTPLPAITTLDLAVEKGEVFYSLEMGAGAAVEEALEAAEHVVEGTYRTGHQEHLYIECQVMTAWFDADGLTVEGSMQCPYYVRNSLQHTFPELGESVRVCASKVGGAFGGKEDYPSVIALHAALLARAAGAPVRLVYDRQEDIIGTTKRHPSRVHHRTGFDRDGRLLAMDIEVVLDGGAYPTLSSVVLSRGVLHAAGAYRCPAVRVKGRAVKTHTATNGAFRGFGAPQTLFAVERQIDRVARKMGLDPLEIRLRNALRAGDRLPTGQILDDSTSAMECLERAAESTKFGKRWHELEVMRKMQLDEGRRRGLGLSLFFHGCGFTGNGERKMRSPVRVQVVPTGQIELLTAMVDMGQGSDTLFVQMTRTAAGLGADDLIFAPPDTSRVPDSGPTVASRTSMVIGGTLAQAVIDLRDRVVRWWLGSAPSSAADDDLELRRNRCKVIDGVVHCDDLRRSFRELARLYFEAGEETEYELRYEPPEWQVFDEETYQGVAYPTYGWGVCVAEVEVDSDTLEIEPIKVTAVCDVGKALHPLQCKGQVEGGTLQAVGWSLLEEMKLANGHYLNDRMATYIIPTIKDSPEIAVELVERPWRRGPFGAKGVGELPMDGPAPAVASAVEQATALHVTQIPITPERLYAHGRGGKTIKTPKPAFPHLDPIEKRGRFAKLRKKR